MFLALAGQLGHMLHRLGPHPLLGPELRLEGGLDGVALPAQRLAQQPRGLLALAVVGVALHQEALGHAVVGGHQHLRRRLGGVIRLTYRAGQRLDVAGMLEVGGHGADRRLPLELHQGAEGVVVGGGGGGRGVLGIEREEQDLLATRRLQAPEHAVGGGVAVAHGEVDHHPLAVARLEPLGHLAGLLPGDGQQRALVLLGVPDAAIGLAGLEGPPREDDQLQQRLPLPAGVVHHPLVGEELAEVATHGPVVGGVRGAQVDQHHPDPGTGDGGMIGWGMDQAALAGAVHLGASRILGRGGHGRGSLGRCSGTAR